MWVPGQPASIYSCLLPAMCNVDSNPLQASFGPFYRITQLILTTTPAANSSFTSPSGLPAIVTGATSGLPVCCSDVAMWPGTCLAVT